MMRSSGKSDPHARLMRALLDMAGEGSEILRSTSCPWASATFTGAQHLADLRYTGSQAHDRADKLAKGLPEAEFAIPGHIVADLSIESRDLGQDEAHLQLAILTVEDW
jgi:hypothetical protein